MAGFALAVLLSFVPALLCAAVVYWIDHFEKEPRILIGAVFFWGAVVATLGAVVSQLFLQGAVHVLTGSEDTASLAGATLFAPLTEESLKGAAVLLVFLVLRREFDSLLDGIVYAGVVALGFAATENVLYIYGGFLEGGFEDLFSIAFLRVGLGAWDHPFYTSFIGIGLAAARLSRSAAVRWLAPPAGWGVAVFTHSLHNSLATGAEQLPALGLLMFLIDWSGWVAIGVLILWSLHREGRLLAVHLADEVERGCLTAQQYRTASSIGTQVGARLRALGSGRLGSTRRFYRLCGELAHKKHQLALLGDENGTGRAIEGLRAELARLSGQADCDRSSGA
jgi:RsiW-degrading membrane proteinase PrsW (M82 family)